MTDFSILLQQGSATLWLFVPSAIMLGALHGLEPGHSKTMMAAFIIAIRGTVGQAVMLGLAATVSHTAVVWAVALVGLHFGRGWNVETSEPYFQVVSAVLIIGVAAWMILRTWRHQNGFGHDHTHDHDHGHEETKLIDIGHCRLRLDIYEEGVPPRFRVFEEAKHGRSVPLDPANVLIETERANGKAERFSFVRREGFLESVEEIPEPHEFMAQLQLRHDNHVDTYDVEYTEHGHRHALKEFDALQRATSEFQDPHELAHANDIRKRFANRDVTNGQILLFGLTGGLVPCPASITVLLLCLQLKKFTLGATLVLSFSLGLALTMVFSGVLAAISARRISKRWSGFGDLAHKAPYLSGGLISLVGLYIGFEGLHALM